MEYLYVCHFSNGHVKVGRSINPKSRIASHADRVACVGVDLVEHHIVECVGYAAPAEAALIERCTELASKRNKNEWFEGLDYSEICAAAQNFSVADFAHKHGNPISRVASCVGSQARLARAINVSTAIVYQWMNGIRPIPDEKCPAIEMACRAAVACEALRPDLTWIRVPDPSWPHPDGRPLLDFAISDASQTQPHASEVV